MLNCKHVTEQTSNYINKDLPVMERLACFVHFLICRNCRRYLKQIEKTILALKLIKPRERLASNEQALAETLQKVISNDKQ